MNAKQIILLGFGIGAKTSNSDNSCLNSISLIFGKISSNQPSNKKSLTLIGIGIPVELVMSSFVAIFPSLTSPKVSLPDFTTLAIFILSHLCVNMTWCVDSFLQ